MNMKIKLIFLVTTICVVNAGGSFVSPDHESAVEIITPEPTKKLKQASKNETMYDNSIQYLMYTVLGSKTIYSYTLDNYRGPVKNGQFNIPFSTDYVSRPPGLEPYLPGLVFNVQLESLEIIGDWSDKTNKNHKMMTTAGYFSDAPGSLFEGDWQFEVCHSPTVGTLVFSDNIEGSLRGAAQVYSEFL